jgi:hypothetical protein
MPAAAREIGRTFNRDGGGLKRNETTTDSLDSKND